MTLLKTAAFAAFALAGVAQAHNVSPITYTGARTVGSNTVDLSLTTDGVFGTLAQADITRYDIIISDAAGSFELTPTNSSMTSFQGFDLSASKTALSFNFSATDGGVLEFYSATLGRYVVESDLKLGPVLLSFHEEQTEGYGSNITSVHPTGNVVLATASVSSGTPEPASWALMLVGFGGICALLRRRSRIGPRLMLT